MLERARKKSLAKEEKDVKLPQKPVARPMYSGMAFFRFVAAALRTCSRRMIGPVVSVRLASNRCSASLGDVGAKTEEFGSIQSR